MMSRLLLLLLILLDLVTHISPQFVSDSCQQTIWDSTSTDPGVHHVFLHCVEGQLTWRYPYGAVRLTLQLGGRKSPFEACFIAQSFSTFAKISLESVVDGEQLLEPLAFLDAKHPHTPREICVRSSAGEAVTLYLESETDQDSRTIGQVELEYDLQRSYERMTPEDNMEDCRPCTDQELMYAVCTSDFAVAGSINAVFHNSHVEETEVHLQVSRILHQRQSLFKLSASSSTPSPHSPMTHAQLTRGKHRRRSRSQHNISSLTFTPSVSDEHKMGSTDAQNDPLRIRTVSQTDLESSGGVVIAPHKCRVRPSKQGGGEDQFLFVGKIRLQRARLQCAPRVEDFEQIWKDAINAGTNPCILD